MSRPGDTGHLTVHDLGKMIGAAHDAVGRANRNRVGRESEAQALEILHRRCCEWGLECDDGVPGWTNAMLRKLRNHYRARGLM